MYFQSLESMEAPGVCRFNLILGYVRCEIFPVALCSIRPPLFLHAFEGETRWWASLGVRCCLFRQTHSLSWEPVTYLSQTREEVERLERKKERFRWCGVTWGGHIMKENAPSSICNARDVLFTIVCACVWVWIHPNGWFDSTHFAIVCGYGCSFFGTGLRFIKWIYTSSVWPLSWVRPWCISMNYSITFLSHTPKQALRGEWLL